MKDKKMLETEISTKCTVLPECIPYDSYTLPATDDRIIILAGDCLYIVSLQ